MRERAGDPEGAGPSDRPTGDGQQRDQGSCASGTGDILATRPGDFQPLRALILRFSSLGDVIQLAAVAEALKARWPRCRVEWLTKRAFAPLVERMPAVDRVWSFEPDGGLGGLRRLCRRIQHDAGGEPAPAAGGTPSSHAPLEADPAGTPGEPARQGQAAVPLDLLLDMHAVPRSLLASAMLPARRTLRYRKPYLRRWLLFYGGRDRFAPDWHVLDHYLAVLARLDPPDPSGRARAARPRLALRAADRAAADALLAARGCPARFAALVVGAAWPQKRWPTEHVVALGRALRERHGLASVVLGGPQDAHAEAIAAGIGAGALALRGALDLPATLALLDRAALIVGNDTGLMHGAEAIGRDVAVLLGPTARQTGAYPWRSGSRVLELRLPCRPCSQKGNRPCQLPRRECLYMLTPARVLAALAPWLARG